MRVRAFAPGRVNLIGDHTDHTGGWVLPMAIQMGTSVSGESGGTVVHLTSETESEPAAIALDVAEPAEVHPRWARYVAGVVAELAPLTGFEGEVTTTLPAGAGVSSSAALTVSVAMALGADLDPVALARVCQRAEQRAVGVPCGIMDQLVSVAGEPGAALLIDTANASWQSVALPDDAEIVLVPSGTQRALAGSAYADVRDRCVTAQERLGPLRDAEPDAWEQLDDPDIRIAARHVISENHRVLRAAEALAAGRLDEVGELMVQSHRSLVSLGVSTPELDQLVDSLLAQRGVFGARLTGAGFGGCVVALAEPGALSMGWVVESVGGAQVTAG